MRVVQVSLGARSYSIRIGRDLLTRIGSECAKLNLGRRCAVISDARVAPLYGKAVLEALASAGIDPVLVPVPAVETSVSLKTVQSCCDLLASYRLVRRSFVVDLGGGFVGDLAGFVVSTYLRGITFVQVPTTLLGQVDSSVGGKVGVNLKAGKNLVGAFYQPRLVLCDLDSHDTLPIREFNAGLGEIIKYGIIRDAKLFDQLERYLPTILQRDSKKL